MERELRSSTINWSQNKSKLVGIETGRVRGIEALAKLDIEDLKAQPAGGLALGQGLRDRHPIPPQFHRPPVGLG